MMRYKLWLIIALSLMLFGCARTPSGVDSGKQKRLIVTIKVKGRINSDYGNYFFLVNSDPVDITKPENAPIPVISPPWGNGVAAGRYNYFVVWGSDFRDYRLFHVDPDNLLNMQEIGRPAFTIQPNLNPDADGANTKTIKFELLLSQIPKTAGGNPDSIRFNIIATDVWGVMSDQAIKRWDALGNPKNGVFNMPIELDLRQNRILTNRNLPEPETDDDVRRNVFENIVAPDLDLLDWQIEIR